MDKQAHTGVVSLNQQEINGLTGSPASLMARRSTDLAVPNQKTATQAKQNSKSAPVQTPLTLRPVREYIYRVK